MWFVWMFVSLFIALCYVGCLRVCLVACLTCLFMVWICCFGLCWVLFIWLLRCNDDGSVCVSVFGLFRLDSLKCLF